MGSIRIFASIGVDDGVEGRWAWHTLCNGIPVGGIYGAAVVFHLVPSPF